MRAPLALALVLALTAAAFGSAGELGFLTLDDPGYVTQNAAVRTGLGPGSLDYAFTSTTLGNWHPLTWLSHMATVEAFGLEPGPHHLVNVALHAANAALLLALLFRATGRIACSFAVAALFAVHPLHVESVAWVAERKDVLSTLFWLLATYVWIRWTRAGGRARYALAFVLLALGLMSKSMLVTLPFTLLLLDAWPLGRFAAAGRPGESARALVVEKLPLFALVAVFCVVTFAVQRDVGAVGDAARYPLGARLANAVVACGVYLRQTVWPAGLAVFYPHEPPSALAVAASAAILVALSALAWRLRHAVPAVAVGWAWFLGTLVPVVGLVQVGNQAHADRYTYVPHIGLFVALVWGVAAAVERRPRLRPAAGALLAAVLALLVPVTRAQVARWESDGTLFGHALEVTERNWLAHDFYGRHLRGQGRVAEAMEHYRAALRIHPEFATAHLNLGVCHADRGELDLAIASFREALRFRPDMSTAWANLAAAYGRSGRLERSLEASRRALEIEPRDANAHLNAAITCLALGRPEDALERFRAAFRLDPTARLKPPALDYAWVLATTRDPALRDGEEALRVARAFCESVGYRSARGLETLAAALAELGRFGEAVQAAEQALAALRRADREPGVARLEAHLERLRRREPLRADTRPLGG